jgi:toxin FitB
VSVLVLDTDVASLSIKGRLSRTMEARLASSALVAVSFATVGELIQWTEMYDWAPNRRVGVNAFLADVVKLPTPSAPRTRGAVSRQQPGSAAVR